MPDTFVDITDVWPEAIEWVGQFGLQRPKEILSAYRGATCNVAYAEAFRADQPSPTGIL